MARMQGLRIDNGIATVCFHKIVILYWFRQIATTYLESHVWCLDKLDIFYKNPGQVFMEKLPTIAG